jgi:hypothetical protein
MTVSSAQADDAGAIYVGRIADAVTYQPRALSISWSTGKRYARLPHGEGAPEGLLSSLTTS